MNRRFWINAAIVTTALLCNGSHAETPKVDNRTLARTLAAMSPDMTTQALSATYVRTIYAPQTLAEHAEHQNGAVQQTTISELVCNGIGVRESVCDARDAAGEIKQFAFHYANNGKRIQTYDSRTNRGYVRPSAQTDTNYLSLLTVPYTGTNRGRFMSRSMPVLLGRFAGATVVTETTGTVEGRTAITMRGEYKNSDPAKYFAVTVLPDCGYAVAELEEYDGGRRILTRAHATGHVNLSGPLWLAKSTWLEKYTYDDHEGNSVQSFKLDMLEPKVVSVDENTFTLALPSNAQIRDVAAPKDLGEIRRQTNDILDATVANLDAPAIPADKHGQEMIDQAQKAYAAERALNDNQERRLELPRQTRHHYWITIPIAGLVAGAMVIGGCILRRRACARNMGTTDQPTRKAGDA